MIWAFLHAVLHCLPAGRQGIFLADKAKKYAAAIVKALLVAYKTLY